MTLNANRRRLAASWFAACLLLAAGGASAQDPGNLYEATVAVGPEGADEAFRAGISEVLVRVTGRRDAPALPGLQALLDDPTRYVGSYRRVAGGRMRISYDGEAIEQAIAAAGLPYWGRQRPRTLVWLAVDRGGGQRGLATADAASSERRAVEQAAAERGLPLVWPSATAGDDPRERFEQVWSGDTASLAAAAGRYGADSVLIGRALATGSGRYTVDWSLLGAAGATQLRGGLADGVDAVADRLASLYASSLAGTQNEVLVTIAGVTTVAQYAEVSRYLESLDVVRDLALQEVLPDALVFRLLLRGELPALQRAAAAGRHLVWTEGGGGRALFTYRP